MTKSTYLTVRENSAKSTSSTETNNVKGTLGPGDKFLKWYTSPTIFGLLFSKCVVHIYFGGTKLTFEPTV